MENKKENVIDIAKANVLARKLQFAVISILTISYIIQVAKQSIGVPQFFILMITLWIPVLGAFLLFKKQPDSGLIKHIIGIGYGIFFVAICIISEEQMVFTFVFPMIIVVGIYCDLKFSIIVSVAASIIAIVHAVNCMILAGFSPESVAALEIEVAASVLVGMYSIISNKFIIDVTGKQLEDINTAKEKTGVMLEQIMDVANTLADEVTVVSDKLEQLESSSEETISSMKEVQEGSHESADAVQNQLHKTEDISGQIESVALATENIGSNVEASIAAISAGRANVKQLIEQTNLSEEAANGAVSEVEELKASTDKMESIVEMISNVASQTSLLSLNASIEAARAGEAGRGFSVVATEISRLASQTQTATEEINTLITNITAEMGEVANAITKLVENNRIQSESAKVTAESFEKIVKNSDDIKDNSEKLSTIVGMLEKSNGEIVESIQTISAITEEVTAHSTSTADITENNREIVRDVKEIVEEMIVNAEKLRALK